MLFVETDFIFDWFGCLFELPKGRIVFNLIPEIGTKQSVKVDAER